MAKFIVTGKLLQALYEAGVITDDPRHVKRIVIDLQAGHIGLIYVQKFLDDEQITVALTGGLEVVATAEEAGKP